MNVYLIGIGGVGCSSVARYLHETGHAVSGVDAVENPTVEELRSEGIEIVVGEHPDRITKDIDMVLMSPALLSADVADVRKAKELGLPLKTWQAYIGELTKEKKTIAICGAHGKSTTTAMVSLLLTEAGMDPTVIIGTKLKEFGGRNVRVGTSEWMVIEADEFNENFLHYHPNYVLVTSYEPDHLDYFGTEERYQEAFKKFYTQVKPGGSIFFHKGDTVTESLAEEKGREVGAYYHGELGVTGIHNRANAALVDSLGQSLGISEDVRQQALASFKGTWRRQERVGEYAGMSVIDDYAHHPTEVRASLQAIKEAYPDVPLHAFFQPHQFSRTRLMLQEFAESFEDADEVYILDIYASRDSQEDLQAVSAQDLVREANKHHPKVHYAGSLEHAEALAKTIQAPGVLLFMGAGTITTIPRKLTKE